VLTEGALRPFPEYPSRNPTLDHWPCVSDQLWMRAEIVPRSLGNLLGLNVRDPHSLSLQFFLDRATRTLKCKDE
jgi:hypothetical protein